MLILVFVLTVLLAAIAALLWCLRGFTRTLKQQGFVGVLVRSEDSSPAGHNQQAAQFEGPCVAAKSLDSESRKSILRTRLGFAEPVIEIQKHTFVMLEGRHRSHIVKDVA